MLKFIFTTITNIKILGEDMSNIVKLRLLFVMIINISAAEDEYTGIRDNAHSIKESISKLSELEKKEISIVGSFDSMFKDAKVIGQIRFMYFRYNYNALSDTYATGDAALVKYELAEYNDFSAAAAFTSSYDISAFTGDNTKFNNEFSTNDGFYAEISELYINYKNSGLNIRIGRQLIDTPLADNDDISMIENSFEAYIATYEISEFSFMFALLKRWHGIDTRLDVDKPWQDTGKKGTYLASIVYSNKVIDFGLWYYDISKSNSSNTATGNIANRSIYTDLSIHLHPSRDIFVHANIQYLNQNESSNSDIESFIYGTFLEVKDITLGIAYNKS